MRLIVIECSACQTRVEVDEESAYKMPSSPMGIVPEEDDTVISGMKLAAEVYKDANPELVSSMRKSIRKRRAMLPEMVPADGPSDPLAGWVENQEVTIAHGLGHVGRGHLCPICIESCPPPVRDALKAVARKDALFGGIGVAVRGMIQ